ncbi:MAG: uroporphyrinogen-III synthase [Planctomycetaceae bacterium]
MPLRVCSFESRRCQEMAALLARCGAVPTVAPSMREVPLESNTAAVGLAHRLVSDQCRNALLILMTGVGTRTLLEAAVTAVARESLVQALNRLTIAIRGPKPVPVLKEWGIHFDFRAPEPNTWHELVQVLTNEQVPLNDRLVIVQEYGAPTTELYEWLQTQGAQVEPIAVYNWELPEDIGPLESAVRGLCAERFDVAMFTSAQQIRHVQEVASRFGLSEELDAAMQHCLLASIGPTTTETILAAGWPAPFEPTHGKMGHLAVEACEFARKQLADKLRGES